MVTILLRDTKRMYIYHGQNHTLQTACTCSVLVSFLHGNASFFKEFALVCTMASTGRGRADGGVEKKSCPVCAEPMLDGRWRIRDVLKKTAAAPAASAPATPDGIVIKIGW